MNGSDFHQLSAWRGSSLLTTRLYNTKVIFYPRASKVCSEKTWTNGTKKKGTTFWKPAQNGSGNNVTKKLTSAESIGTTGISVLGRQRSGGEGRCFSFHPTSFHLTYHQFNSAPTNQIAAAHTGACGAVLFSTACFSTTANDSDIRPSVWEHQTPHQKDSYFLIPLPFILTSRRRIHNLCRDVVWKYITLVTAPAGFACKRVCVRARM